MPLRIGHMTTSVILGVLAVAEVAGLVAVISYVRQRYSR